MHSKTVSQDRPTGAKGEGPKPYTLRGIENETRVAIAKAAKRSGEPVGQWVNKTLRAAAQDELKQSQQVGPTQDQMLAGLMENMRVQAESTRQLSEQVTQVTQLLQAQQKPRDSLGTRLARALHLVP